MFHTSTLSNVYGLGPDWATGYGLINAQKAVQYSDRTKFREDTVNNRQSKCYSLTVPSGTSALRATLSWDDPGMVPPYDDITCFNAKLVNDLDVYLLPPGSGTLVRPWVLNSAPLTNRVYPPYGLDSLITPNIIKSNTAYKARDSLNNLEVVDVTSPVAGMWKVIVEGKSIAVDQSRSRGLPGTINNQDFSLVTDFPITVDTTTGFFWKRNGSNRASNTITGDLRLSRCYISGSHAGFLIRNNNTTRASVDTLGNIHSASLADTAQPWIDNPGNLPGTFVVRGPGNRVRMQVDVNGAVRIGAYRRCNSM